MINPSNVQVQLLSLAGNDTTLRKVTASEYAGPCPECGGTDRFRLWPDRGRFWCRQCDAKGDAIDYVRWQDGVGFVEACELLGIDTPRRGRAVSNSRRQERAPLTPPQPDLLRSPSVAWQRAAFDFWQDCQEALLSPDGEGAIGWLRDKRLLDYWTISRYGLAYNPATYRGEWGESAVYIERGIIIPWIINGTIWAMNNRRPSGKPKYKFASGSVGRALYRVQYVEPGATVFIVEGEFDCLLLQQAAEHAELDSVVTVATGSITGGRATRWIAKLALAERVLVAFDVGDGNQKGTEEHAAYWLGQFNNAQRVIPPGHDFTDAARAGVDLAQWIGEVLNVK